MYYMVKLDRKESKHPLSTYLRLLILGLIALSGLLLVQHSPLGSLLTDTDRLGQLLNNPVQSFWTPLIFVAVYAGATTLGIPGTAATIAGGAIFGAFWGTILNTFGANISATLSFLISRKLGRTALKNLIKNDLNISDSMRGPKVFWTLLSLRLFPLIPFTTFNFTCGVTNLPWRTYAFATAIGMLPWTILYTIFADTALDISQEFSPKILANLLISGLLIITLLKLSHLVKKNRS
jgi:uncharacterized membrane protein YdjX (TVP38/TMEM64 family)